MKVFIEVTYDQIKHTLTQAVRDHGVDEPSVRFALEGSTLKVSTVRGAAPYYVCQCQGENGETRGICLKETVADSHYYDVAAGVLQPACWPGGKLRLEIDPEKGLDEVGLHVYSKEEIAFEDEVPSLRSPPRGVLQER